MKGGLLINSSYFPRINNIEEAVKNFKSNSKFSILTNSSNTCITFKATLNEHAISPFIHIRSGIIDRPVTTLLFKYFLISPYGNTSRLDFNTNKPRNKVKQFIELSQARDIKEEFRIQSTVYQTTYNTISSAYEPACPYPISCSTDLDKVETIQEIKNKLDEIDKIKKETDSLTITDTLCGTLDGTLDGVDESNFSIATPERQDRIGLQDTLEPTIYDLKGDDARKGITTLGCIVMEYMDGYITLKAYLDTVQGTTLTEKEGRERALSLAAYELVRLKQIGFIHGDLVTENIMYNPNYEYITDTKHPLDKGRALLIDFGNSSIDLRLLRIKENEWIREDQDEAEKLLRAEAHRYGMIVYEERGQIQKFYKPCTFQIIYERRFNATLEFRKKIIKQFQDFITENNTKIREVDEQLSKKIKDFKDSFLAPFVYALDQSGARNYEFPDYFNDAIGVFWQTKYFNLETLDDNLTTLEDKAISILKKLSDKEKPPKKQKQDKPKIVNLLKELIENWNFQKKASALPESGTESGSDSEDCGGGRLINYDKKHKVYNKRFSHSLYVNQYDGRIRNTLKIKYRRTKKSKRKKSKRKKNKNKKSKNKKSKNKKSKNKKSKQKKGKSKKKKRHT